MDPQDEIGGEPVSGIGSPAEGAEVVEGDNTEGQLGTDEQADVESTTHVERAAVATEATPPTVIAIASGKGGVGKSLLAASVSIYFAQLNKQVVLVDTNFGCSNLHTLVGVSEIPSSLHRFLRNEIKRLSDVVSPTSFGGLGLIAGLDNGLGAANPRPSQRRRLLAQLPLLRADYVVVDIAAGSGFDVLDTFLAADHQILITEPEPTAIETAFRLIKSAFLRKLRGVRGLDELLAAPGCDVHGGLVTPHQLRQAAQHRDPELAQAITTAMAELRPLLVVNNTRTRDDLELGPALTIVARRHLGLPVEYLGHIEADDMVWVSVRKRRPLLVEYPEAKVSRDIERLARRLLTRGAQERPTPEPLPNTLDDQNHYELLGLHPAASEEEIRRAHRQVRRLYDPSSNAIYGLAPPEEANRFLRRIEQAYATLIDPYRQRSYNESIFPEWPLDNGAAQASKAAAQLADALPALDSDGLAVPRALPQMPELGIDTIFTGELLRRVREARGIDLQELADRTKISVSYLRSIEEEHFPNAPAPVYVRGFVKAVAQYLGLEPDRVAGSYMVRFETSRKRAAGSVSS